jgi:hypothetical protein
VAALALGADGINMGTRFIATEDFLGFILAGGDERPSIVLDFFAALASLTWAFVQEFS